MIEQQVLQADGKGGEAGFLREDTPQYFLHILLHKQGLIRLRKCQLCLKPVSQMGVIQGV